jgi:hypothetical protein
MMEGKITQLDQGDPYCEEGLDIPVNDRMRANYDNSWWYPHCLRPDNRKPDFVVLPNQEQIEGAWCHVVDCGGNQKLWVDPQLGFALRRKQRYKPGGARLADYSFSKFSEPVKGLWLPTVWARVTIPGDDDLNKSELEMLVEVKALSVNQVADRDFDLVLPPGTMVSGLGKGFVTGGDKTQLLDLAVGDLLQKEKSRSLRAWLTINGLLAVGLAAAAAIYWRWRSKSRAPLNAGGA